MGGAGKRGVYVYEYNYNDDVGEYVTDALYVDEYDLTTYQLPFDGADTLSDGRYLPYIYDSNIGARVFVSNMKMTYEGCYELMNMAQILNEIRDYDFDDYSRMFAGCSGASSNIVVTISQYATDLSHMFDGCDNVSGVTMIFRDTLKTYDVSYMFRFCAAVKTISFSGATISVRNPISMFMGCYNVTNIGSMVLSPDTTDISGMFYDCNVLTQSPLLNFGTSSVEDMGRTFYGCLSLTRLPPIPSSVTNLGKTFTYCEEAVNVGEIVVPSGVVCAQQCFYRCRKISGNVYLLSNTQDTYEFLKGTASQIVLYTLNQKANEIVSEAGGNVRLANGVGITILGTSVVTNNNNRTVARVDMLLDCKEAGYIVSTPNVTLYDMDDNIIQIGIGVKPPEVLRCYAIYNTNAISQVQNTGVVQVQCFTPNPNLVVVALPSTATPSIVKQEGRTSPISPRIDVESVRFNPETTGLNTYNVKVFLNNFGVQTTSNYTKSQTNVDGDVKHVVTHADNVMINDTTTLQDWITEQYSYLT